MQPKAGGKLHLRLNTGTRPIINKYRKGKLNFFFFLWASLGAQRLKHLPAMWETRVRSLGWEDPLEKEMATHASTLAGESHGQRSLIGYSPCSIQFNFILKYVIVNMHER